MASPRRGGRPAGREPGIAGRSNGAGGAAAKLGTGGDGVDCGVLMVRFGLSIVSAFLCVLLWVCWIRNTQRVSKRMEWQL